jgi:uncharacterized membrane protein
MARRTVASKHLALLAIGTFVILLGGIISAVGAFRSVMHDPKAKGPYSSSDTNTRSAFNYRHYVALISYYPEIFNCNDINDIYGNTNGLTDIEHFIPDVDDRDTAKFYCWRESGDAAWLYAFGFVILHVYLILAFIAAFRASGHQASIAGVGFSVVILAWALLTIVHYQEHNNIPKALTAFGSCPSFAAADVTRTIYAPWTPATAGLYPDFGLEVWEGANPASLQATRLGQVRAFYYSRRGGSDILDENLIAGFLSTPLNQNAPYLQPATPVIATTTTAGVTVTTTTTGTTTIISAVPTTTVAQNNVIPVRHGNADGNTYFIDYNFSPARVVGPTPKRAWLCNDDWNYDGTFRVSQNLVYGGLATVIVGAFLVLTAFAYLAHPFLGVVKAPKQAIQQQRSSNLAADLGEDYTYTSDY